MRHNGPGLESGAISRQPPRVTLSVTPKCGFGQFSRLPLVATGFTPASHLSWWIMTGCGVLVLALGILTTSRWARRTADATAATFSSDEPRIAVTTS